MDDWLLLIFIVYQIYRMTFAPSFGLAALTAFDVFVVWLTYREYGKQRSRLVGPRAFRVLR